MSKTYTEEDMARAVASAVAPLKRANLELTRVNHEQRLQEQRLDLALKRAAAPQQHAQAALNVALAIVQAVRRDGDPAFAHLLQAFDNASQQPAAAPCKGKDCTSTDGANHSAACQAEHEATIGGFDSNNEPQARYAGYKGHPLPDGATDAQKHAYAVGKAAAAPDLNPVIQWLENGCDPKEAAKELRLLQKALGQPSPVQREVKS